MKRLQFRFVLILESDLLRVSLVLFMHGNRNSIVLCHFLKFHILIPCFKTINSMSFQSELLSLLHFFLLLTYHSCQSQTDPFKNLSFLLLSLDVRSSFPNIPFRLIYNDNHEMSGLKHAKVAIKIAHIFCQNLIASYS